MPKYLDGVKKVTVKKTSPKKSEQPKKEGEDITPVFKNAKKSIGDFLNLQKEVISKKKEDQRSKAIIKREEKMQKEQERLEKIEKERQEKVEKIWQTAEEAKKIEENRKLKKLRKKRAREKLKADRLAMKMQRRHEGKGKKNDFSKNPEYKEVFLKTLNKKLNFFKFLNLKNLFIKSFKKLGVYMVLLVVLIFLVFVSLVFITYRLPANNPVRQVVIHNLPMPAMFINYRPASYRSYINEDRWFGYYYLSQTEIFEADKSNAQKILEIKNNLVFENFLEKNILKRLQNKYNVVVHENEKISAFEKIAEGNGGVEKFTDDIYNKYGLTKDIFVDNVAYYEALKLKLDEVFINDSSVHNAARLRVNNVLKQLDKGASFEELAEKYSEDSHALKGGDIGYVKVNEMAETLQEAVLKMNKDMVSEVLKDKNRYYIVKLYDRTQSRNGEEVWLKQISIFTNYSFLEYLEDLKTSAKVWNFVK